jgi:hypothetical protein
LQWVNSLASLLNLFSLEKELDKTRTNHDLWDELGNEFLDIRGCCLLGHNINHLFTDLSDLGILRIGGLLDLVLTTLGESNGKDSDQVSVSGLDINKCLDQ